MNLQKVDTVKSGEYMKQIFSFRSYTNYFGQAFAEGDLYLSTDHTFILAKPQEDFFRLFVASDNREDLVELLKLMGSTNVLNIPSKGDISEWKRLMSDAGYKHIGIYERYFYTKFRQGGLLSRIKFAQPGQAKEIYDLLYGYEGFSPYTDYLPSMDELCRLIKDGFAIVNELSGHVAGTYLFNIEGKKCYLRIWIDKSVRDGFKLLFNMHTIMREKEITYAYFWVNSENEKVKKIHRFMGAKPDGLKDYAFLKKIKK